MKVIVTRVVPLCVFTLLLASCSVGRSVRELDIRKDLSGLDLAHLQATATEYHFENEQSLGGQLAGLPFWFAPALTLEGSGSHALHRGPVLPSKADKGRTILALATGKGTRVAEISGYRYSKISALGAGVLTYHNKNATWDSEGSLDHWNDTFGIGWGLIYSHRSAGEGDSRTAQSAKILSGLLGYTEEQGKGYLHLLWIPIPW